jgi:hypothetical protein
MHRADNETRRHKKALEVIPVFKCSSRFPVLRLWQPLQFGETIATAVVRSLNQNRHLLAAKNNHSIEIEPESYFRIQALKLVL